MSSHSGIGRSNFHDHVGFRRVSGHAYLKNDGKLEHARQMAAHASARTTQLYDRRSDEVSLDEVERIVI